jgi:hypothetical protein
MTSSGAEDEDACSVLDSPYSSPVYMDASKCRSMTPHSSSELITVKKKREANRRQSIRYAVNAPLQYRIIRDGKPGLPFKGQVLDMSAAGLRITTVSLIEPGTEVEIGMDWPGIYHGVPKVRLMLTAEVLRSEEGSAALRIVRHEFRGTAATRLHPMPPAVRRAVA